MRKATPIFETRATDKHSAFHMSFKTFDWKAAGTAFVIAGMALLWWLSQTFVTLKQYDHDQQTTASMLQEIRTDVKDILKKAK